MQPVWWILTLAKEYVPGKRSFLTPLNARHITDNARIPRTTKSTSALSGISAFISLSFSSILQGLTAGYQKLKYLVAPA
jgi:hypothetical protein